MIYKYIIVNKVAGIGTQPDDYAVTFTIDWTYGPGRGGPWANAARLGPEGQKALICMQNSPEWTAVSATTGRWMGKTWCGLYRRVA